MLVVAGGTVAAQTAQRFSDVPPDHEAHEAVEWAADVGLTLGYGDGTFGPDEPLPKRHALVFMERFYDDILQADESPDFTRSASTADPCEVWPPGCTDTLPTRAGWSPTTRPMRSCRGSPRAPH